MSVLTFEDAFKEMQFVPLDSQKKVGNYIVGKTIGEGAFSKVRLGKHVNTGEKVAIKILPKKTIQKKQSARRRFLSETHALRSLQHPNIVQLLEVMETERNYYLVLELVKGENFRQYLKTRGCLPEFKAKVLLTQIARAVQHMHGTGIVHRDLKPDNFIIHNDHLKIVDFGLSGVVRQEDTLSTQCGSPVYTAPEILTRNTYTQAVDMWSIGIILYVMVSSNVPYTTDARRNSYMQLYSKILRGYDVPCNVSNECKDLLSKLLKVDPVNRLNVHGLLDHAWLAIECVPLPRSYTVSF